jgi:hypothetical protein
VPPLSHNVVAKQNMVVGWIPQMAIILVENNGAWHIALVDPIKFVGVLGLKIKLGTFLAPHQKLMPHMIGNDVCQHKWLWKPHLSLSFTMLRIQSFISTLWF